MSEPPDTPDLEQLARIRSQLTYLVDRRLARGLTDGEEADYRRLTEAERLLLRRIGPTAPQRAPAATAEAADAGATGGNADTPGTSAPTEG